MKKVKHAQEPATAEPEAKREDQPVAGLEPEAAALVEGDGAAADRGAEDAGRAAAADGRSHQSWLGDADIPFGAGGDLSRVEATEPGGPAQDAAEDGAGAGAGRDVTDDFGDGSGLGANGSDGNAPPSNAVDADQTGIVVSDGAFSTDGADAGGETKALADAAGSDSADHFQSEDDGAAAASGSGDRTGIGDGEQKADESLLAPVEGSAAGAEEHGSAGVTDPDGNPPVDQAPSDPIAEGIDGDDDRDNDVKTIFDADPKTFFQDERQQAATVAAASAAFAFIGEEGMNVYMEAYLPQRAVWDATSYVRAIGARATAPVLATELKLKGHPTHEAGALGLLVLDIFASTLIKLDAHHKAEAERLAREKEEAERKPPPPVPIEDTTLETVDDPMSTWRV